MSATTARAYLAEARHRRHDPVNRDFYWRLLAWARAARLRITRESVQRDLFGGGL